MAKTPDPTKFAQIVLWNQACIRQELSLLRADVAIHITHGGSPDAQRQLLRWRKRAKQLAKRFFETDLQTCGLDIEPPPTEPGWDPR